MVANRIIETNFSGVSSSTGEEVTRTSIEDVVLSSVSSLQTSIENRLDLGASVLTPGSSAMSIAVTEGESWQIQWISVLASPNATAGNRRYRLRIDSTGPTFVANVNIVASTPTTIFWIAGIDSDVEISSNTFRVGIPALILRSGTVITIENTGTQGVGDTLTGSIEFIKVGTP